MDFQQLFQKLVGRYFLYFHQWLFEATDGRISWLGGLPVLLLRTVGRKTGMARTASFLHLGEPGEPFCCRSFEAPSRSNQVRLTTDYVLARNGAREPLTAGSDERLASPSCSANLRSTRTVAGSPT